MINLLLIEDDKVIREGVQAFLTESGYKVFTAESAEEGLLLLEELNIHLLLLDILLPGMSGIELLEKIKKTSELPVIMLTALEDEKTQLASFNALCDDYVSKPFSLLLLKKRIEALLRRVKVSEETFKYKGAFVDFSSCEASFQGEGVKLTTKEIEILKFLVEEEGKVLSRSKIMDHLWDYAEEEPLERVIDVYIKNLRKKLHLDCIHTIKGMGYKLKLEDNHERH